MGQELFVLEGFLLAFNPMWAILFRLEKKKIKEPFSSKAEVEKANLISTRKKKCYYT